MTLSLPGDEGPTTPELVADLRNVSAAPDEPDLAEVVAGVNAYLRRFLSPGGDGMWAADHVLGATLLAGQIWKRRESGGAGVEIAPSGDPIYIQRNHPDIARLLGVGPWVRPVVG